MRHNKAGRRLGRTTSHRTAMFRNMVTSFLQHESITTTDAKAKELRPIAEKLITLGKRGDLHAIRQASSFLRDKKVVTKLVSVIGPRYKDREGGYTRIIKIGQRAGDASPVSVIQLVEEQIKTKDTKKPAKKTVAAKAEPKEITVAETPQSAPVKAESVTEEPSAES